MSELYGRLIILCGLPGSGKTTAAGKLVDQFAGVRFSPDEWMTELCIDGYDQQARARIEALQWSLSEALLRLGLTVIVEWGVWTQAERDTLRTRCRELGAAVELRYLDVPVDVLWDRLEARNDSQPWGSFPIERDDLDVWAREFEAPSAEEIALFDPPRSGMPRSG